MPKFQVSEYRAVWVKEFYEVEADDVDAAQDTYQEGEYLGFEMAENVEHMDTEQLTIEESDVRPFVVHSCVED